MPFEVELAQSGQRFTVPADQSILDCLIEHGCDPMFDCKRGECGVCATPVHGGRDRPPRLCADRPREGGGQRHADLHLARQGAAPGAGHLRFAKQTRSIPNCHGHPHDFLPRQPRGQCARWCSPTEVHRDLYTSHELFELEQEHFFANTWNYVGHESQLPKPGDYISTEIAGRPLIVVRHTDGSRARDDEPLRPQGLAAGRARPAATPASSSAVPYHAWTFKTDGSLLAIPLKNGYEGTQLHECESAKGLTTVKNVRSYRGFIFVKINDVGPRLRGVLRRLAELHRQHGRPLARGRARDRRRLPALHAPVQLEDVRREPQRHHAPHGGARILRRHRQAHVGRQARGRAQAHGGRAVRALHVRLQVLRGHGHPHLRQRPQLHRACTSASTASTRRFPRTTTR